MDLVGRAIERLEIDAHHAAVVHAPRKAHQQAMDRPLAPVGDERAAQRRVERDLQFMDGHRPLGDLHEIDAFDGAPADQPEGLDEDAILVGADGRPPDFEQRNIVIGEGSRCGSGHQPVSGSHDPGGGDEDQRHCGCDVDGKIDVVARVGDRIATDVPFLRGCDHANLQSGKVESTSAGVRLQNKNGAPKAPLKSQANRDVT